MVLRMAIGAVLLGRRLVTKRASARHGRCRRAQKGFTLIEVQVATLLFVIAVLTMVSHAQVYGDIVAWLENDRSVTGTVDVEAERAVLAVAQAGQAPGPPPCRVRLLSADYSGTNGSKARVELTDRSG